MPRIFVSHIREDAVPAAYLVEFLRKKLEVRSYEVFVSSNQYIELGSDWMLTIGESFARVTVIISILSAESAARQWIHFEPGGAWLNRGMHLVPRCIGGMKPAELGEPYADTHDADLDDHATASVWGPSSLTCCGRRCGICHASWATMIRAYSG